MYPIKCSCYKSAPQGINISNINAEKFLKGSACILFWAFCKLFKTTKTKCNLDQLILWSVCGDFKICSTQQHGHAADQALVQSGNWNLVVAVDLQVDKMYNLHKQRSEGSALNILSLQYSHMHCKWVTLLEKEVKPDLHWSSQLLTSAEPGTPARTSVISLISLLVHHSKFSIWFSDL